MLRCMPGAVLGVGERELRRHDGAPVAALRAVAVVAERGHELGPRARDAPGVPAALGRRARERVPGNRRARRRGTRRPGRRRARRVGERPDHVEELDERARPAVREDERERVGLGRARVEEVHAGAVDLGEEVVELVEARLASAPVVVVAPVGDELLQVAALGAVVPARVGDLLREAGAPSRSRRSSRTRVGDVDAERLDASSPTASVPEQRAVRDGLAPVVERHELPRYSSGVHCSGVSNWRSTNGPVQHRDRRPLHDEHLARHLGRGGDARNATSGETFSGANGSKSASSTSKPASCCVIRVRARGAITFAFTP